jgi:drug/metabolite transporter (DMT)-like permease
MQTRTLLLTCFAMIAFAANSLLGRLGLVEGGIGAGSFALIRLLSGALILALIAGPVRSLSAGSWAGAASLIVYAAFFSYAYTALPAGTGALILFAMVQVTMVGAGLVSGERLSTLQWSGLSVAILALIWLLSPGLDTPPLRAAGMMAIAGIGWGAYSLLGRRATGTDPTRRTAGNFLRASLLAVLILPLILWRHPEPIPETYGILLAIISGAVTSGLGYAIWYAALRSLPATKAGIAQLTVPAIAALGGILVLDEQISLRFVLASTLILAGVGLATLTKAARKTN